MIGLLYILLSCDLAVHSNVLTRVRAVTFVLQVSQMISKVR